MPKRKNLEIDKTPYQYKTKALKMTKSYTKPVFGSSTILTNDPFAYVEFYFNTKPKAMKYRNKEENKPKFGDEKKYHYMFYWKQAMNFYEATKTLPIESMPLTAYYCMLNAVKAFLSYSCEFIEDFVNDFNGHGLGEGKLEDSMDLASTSVYRMKWGVFYRLGKMIEPDFENIWKPDKVNAIPLKRLLYNLAYIHRAYITTYTSTRGAKVSELFLPIVAGKSPYYCKGNDTNLYLTVELEKSFFPASAVTIPKKWVEKLGDELMVDKNNSFILHSKEGAKWNSNNSLSAEFKELNSYLRKKFQYIKSSKKLWYLKMGSSDNPNAINLNSMLITMAVMHRLSEIVRYKPEQLANLLSGKESWLLHEFLTLALDQFIDELAAEITGQELMETGIK